VFFGDMVDRCYKLCITQGNTLLIPSGWIHAVYTPEDTLVFGGNFLHGFGIGMQLKTAQIESQIRTPPKFRFPMFESMQWYALAHYLRQYQGGRPVTEWEREGLLVLVRTAYKWAKSKEHSKLVPEEISSPLELLNAITKFIVPSSAGSFAPSLVPSPSSSPRHLMSPQASGSGEPSSFEEQALESPVSNGSPALSRHNSAHVSSPPTSPSSQSPVTPPARHKKKRTKDKSSLPVTSGQPVEDAQKKIGPRVASKSGSKKGPTSLSVRQRLSKKLKMKGVNRSLSRK